MTFTLDHSLKFQAVVICVDWTLHGCLLHGIEDNGLGSVHISSSSNSLIPSNGWHTTFLSFKPPPHNSEH